jgi:hypothetical protein
MSEKRYWGENGKYGPYTPQADGWPNAGEVMRAYRERLGLRAEDFANIYSEALQKLGKPNKRGKQGKQGRVTGNWILNMEKQNTVPADIERRRIIVSLLHIPPILFGLGQFEEIAYQQADTAPIPTPSPKDESLTGNTTLKGANGVPPVLAYTSLDLDWRRKEARVLWQLHYAQTAQDAVPDLITATKLLAPIQRTAQGDFKRHISEIMNSYCRLTATVLRDFGDFEQAYLYANKGVWLAEAMGNDPYASQILSASYYTRGVINFAWGVFGSSVKHGVVTLSKEKIAETISDFELALKRANPQLRGIIYSEMARAKALIAASPSDITIALRLLEQAEQYINVDNHDDFYTQILLYGDLKGLDEKRLVLCRAKALLAMKRPAQALEELEDLELLKGGANHTRRRGWTEIYYAQAALDLGNYPTAIAKTIDAFTDCQEVHSIAHLGRVNELYVRLLRSPYKDDPEVKQLGRHLSKIFPKNA